MIFFLPLHPLSGNFARVRCLPWGGGSLTGLHEDREVAPRDVPFYWDVSRVANNGSGFLFH